MRIRPRTYSLDYHRNLYVLLESPPRTLIGDIPSLANCPAQRWWLPSECLFRPLRRLATFFRPSSDRSVTQSHNGPPVPVISMTGMLEQPICCQQRINSQFPSRRTQDRTSFGAPVARLSPSSSWYLRAVLPKTSESFAFMFSVEANSNGTNGTVQVAGPDDKNYVHQLCGGLTGFCASSKLLNMCHWGSSSTAAGSPRFLSLSEFERHITTGYQLSANECAGHIPVGSSGRIQWGFDFMPVISWGDRDQQPRCTATWVSRFPIFEPGYQILMAHGIATGGKVRYCGKLYEMKGARVYAEKNWGASFPSKWWWMQANAFRSNHSLSVTAVGAKRMIMAWEETIGMIAIHLDGSLYEFSNCK